MTFIKRLFSRKEKHVAEPLRGGLSAVGADAERAAQGAARKHMEAEVAGDRERRGATDVRPRSDP
ncbi:MAG: hypothetical protein WEC75_11430 [Dehalococcoidia bacterium]